MVWSFNPALELVVPGDAGPTTPQIRVTTDIPDSLNLLPLGYTVTAAVVYYFDASPYPAVAYAFTAMGYVTASPTQRVLIEGSFSFTPGITIYRVINTFSSVNRVDWGASAATRVSNHYDNSSLWVESDSALYVNSSDCGAKAISHLNVGLTLDTWVNLTVLNGWSNRAGQYPVQYQMLASPANGVFLRGGMVPPNATQGTNIFNLPSEAIPQKDLAPLVTINTVPTSQLAHLQIYGWSSGTPGRVEAWGNVPQPNTWDFGVIYTTD